MRTKPSPADLAPEADSLIAQIAYLRQSTEMMTDESVADWEARRLFLGGLALLGGSPSGTMQ